MQSAMEKHDVGCKSLEADSGLQKQMAREELESQAVDTAESESVIPIRIQIHFSSMLR